MVPPAESVLVVDDEPMVRALVQDILSREGYPVLDAGNPWEALGVAETHPISVLLTDIVMPKMNGYEMAMRIESVRPEAKVLFMSAHAEHGMLIPKPHFIAKPFTVDGILQAVSEVLRPSRRPGMPSVSLDAGPATSPESGI